MIDRGIIYTTGLTLDASGNVYLTNAAGNSVSKIRLNGNVITFATGLHTLLISPAITWAISM